MRREIGILMGFYHLQPAYRLAHDLGVDIKVITRVYQRLREVLYPVTELEGGKLKGEIELDEAYFGGRRKGERGRGAAGKSVVFGLLERDGGSTPKGWRVSPPPSEVISRSSVRGNTLRLISPSHGWISAPKTTSMASRAFEATPSIFCTTTGVFQSITFPCILRRSSTATIIEKRICSNASLHSCWLRFALITYELDLVTEPLNNN